MMETDDKFFAWLDGELTGAEAAEVEARVAASPELQKHAAAHRGLTARLKSAFDPIAEQTVSVASFAPRSADSNVVGLAEARVARTLHFTQRPWAQAAAIALVFVTGLATGSMLFKAPDSSIASEEGRLVAAASLETSLHSQLASQPTSEGPRIGLTFRDRGGNICRSFTDRAATGLACLEEGDWRVQAVFQQPEGQSTDYRMASAADPRLAALIEATIAGEPFDAAQERQSRDRGWK